MDTAILDTIPEPLWSLEPVDFLLKDENVRERLLGELEPERAGPAAAILEYAVRLEAETSWNGEALAQNLGCPIATIEDFKNLSQERLEISSDYLALLAELAVAVETTFDKRSLLLGYGHLYRRAGESTAGVRNAFYADSGSARFYLELGEVQTALDLALCAIDPGAFSESLNPFEHLPRVHIATTRLDALIAGEHEALGASVVVRRMREHVFGAEPEDPAGCEACREALEYRRARLDEERRAVHSSVS